MKLTLCREDDGWQLQVSHKVYLHLINEWSQLFIPNTWTTYHPILIEYDHDTYVATHELALIVLGLGVRLTLVDTTSPEYQKLTRLITKVTKRKQPKDEV